MDELINDKIKVVGDINHKVADIEANKEFLKFLEDFKEK